MTQDKNQCSGCAVHQGTHKPAEAVHQIGEPAQQPEALRLIVQDLRAMHGLATPGKWTKGKTTHITVSERDGPEFYYVAEFRHANDATFCDLAHRHVPRLLDELERLQAENAAALEKAKKYDHLLPYLCKTCGGFGLVDRRCHDAPLGAEPCPDCAAPAVPAAVQSIDWETAATEIAVKVADNCGTVPNLTHPHIYLGLKKLFATANHADSAPAARAVEPAAVAVPDERSGWSAFFQWWDGKSQSMKDVYRFEGLKGVAYDSWKAALAATPAAVQTHAEAAAALGINSALTRIRAGNHAEAIEPLEHALRVLAATPAATDQEKERWCKTMDRPASSCGCPDCGSSLIDFPSKATPAAAPVALPEPDAWAAVHSGGKRDGKIYNTCDTKSQIDAYINQVEQSSDSITLRAAPIYLHAAPQAQADARDAVLAHLDGLLDDAAAHIYPSDLRKCQTGECTVTVASVRMGNRDERSVPLYSREQVEEAFDAAQAAQGGE